MAEKQGWGEDQTYDIDKMAHEASFSLIWYLPPLGFGLGLLVPIFLFILWH